MVKYTRHHDGRFAKVGKGVSADALHKAKQAQLAKRVAGSSTTVPKLHALFAARIRSLDGASDKKTVTRNRSALARCNAWLIKRGADPNLVTHVLIEDYFKWLKLNFAQTSASREAAMVKAAYRYAKRLGMIDSNPAEYVKAPAVDEAEPEVYSNDELRLIRAALRDDLDEVIFYGLVYEGLRRFELVNLTWKRETDPANYINLPKQEMTVLGKGGKLRKVPIHPFFAEVLTYRRQRSGDEGTVLGRGGSLRNVNQRIENMLERAGVDGGNRPAHKFRKTVQTVLYEEGVRTDVIDKMLGWAPSSVRQRYYSRVRDEAMYEGILKLYPSDPIERPPSGLGAPVSTTGVAAA